MLAAFLVASGCVDAGAAPKVGASSPDRVGPVVDPDLPTGSLRGKILNDEQLPIPNATVILVGLNASATTGEDGAFAFHVVNAGEYFLVARADGYKEKQRGVSVLPDATTEVTLLLDSIPKPVSRKEMTQFVQALNCRVRIFSPAGATNANSKNTCLGTVGGQSYVDNRSGSLTADIGLVGLVAEAKWQPSQSTSRNLDFEISLPFGKENKPEGAVREVTGGSPQHVILKRADLEAYLAGSPGRINYYVAGGPVYFYLEVAASSTGGAVDLGFAISQRVDILFTHFYVAEPDDYAKHKQF